jgi:hypothetical protein
MNEPHIEAPMRRKEHSFQNIETNDLPQMTNLSPHSHRDMHGKAPLQDGPLVVRHAWPFTCWFASCAVAFATPTTKSESELFDLIQHIFSLVCL